MGNAARAIVSRARTNGTGEDGVWLPRQAAAEVLGISRTDIGRKAARGEVPKRIEGGVTVFRVDGATARAMLRERRRGEDADTTAAVVRAVASGSTPIEIASELGVSPAVVARVYEEAAAAIEAADRFEAVRQDAERRRRLWEYERCSQAVPTSWAWAARRSLAPFAEARAELDAWIDGGGDESIISFTVTSALASEGAWTNACARWTVEKAEAEAAAKAAEASHAKTEAEEEAAAEVAFEKAYADLRNARARADATKAKADEVAARSFARMMKASVPTPIAPPKKAGEPRCQPRRGRGSPPSDE